MLSIVVHCQSAGPRSPKPGVKLNSAQFGPENTTEAGKASIAETFVDGQPGLQLALANLTVAAVSKLEAGAVYRVTFEKLP